MMREMGYEIIGHILLARLKVIKENFKHLGTQITRHNVASGIGEDAQTVLSQSNRS